MTSLSLALLWAPAHAGEVFDGREYCVGDPHAHTGISGDGASADVGRAHCPGCGTLEGLTAFAAARGLDWVAVTDHVNGGATMDEAGWERLRATLARPSPVTVVPAAELAFAWPGGEPLGHRSLLLFGNDDALRGLTLEELRPAGTSAIVEACDDLSAWMQRLTAARGPALLLPHHPAVALPSATDWSCHHPAWAPVAEVYSSHGNSLDDTHGYDLSPFLDADGLVRAAIDAGEDGPGLRVGFIAGSDRHDTRPGDVCSPLRFQVRQPYLGGVTLAAVPAETGCTRAALHEALAARRTVASTGPAVPLRVTWSQHDVPIADLGSEVRAHPDAPLDLAVSVPAAWARWVAEAIAVTPEGEVPLVPDGGAWRARFAPDAHPAWAWVSVRLAGTHADACADGGDDTDEYLWASPGWIVAAPEDADGDGSPWHADCDEADPDTYPGAPDAARDGADHDCDGRDEATDADADGVPWPWDCDDGRANVHPAWTAVAPVPDAPCDGVDQDCDGEDAGPCGTDTREPTGQPANPSGCGCAAHHGTPAAPAPGAVALALLAGSLTRRRR
jgi:MYXO-CTERM domain-containing protein